MTPTERKRFAAASKQLRERAFSFIKKSNVAPEQKFEAGLASAILYSDEVAKLAAQFARSHSDARAEKIADSVIRLSIMLKEHATNFERRLRELERNR